MIADQKIVLLITTAMLCIGQTCIQPAAPLPNEEAITASLPQEVLDACGNDSEWEIRQKISQIRVDRQQGYTRDQAFLMMIETCPPEVINKLEDEQLFGRAIDARDCNRCQGVLVDYVYGM